MRPAGLAHRD